MIVCLIYNGSMSNPSFDTYRSLVLPGLKRRRVDVWLPGLYHQDPSIHLPVLYMNDGQNAFTRSPYVGSGWMLHERIAVLAEEGKIVPPIVVAMTSTMNRFGEYLPQKPLAYPGALEYLNENKPWRFDPANVHSDQYLRLIVEEIKPMIDSRYRVLSDAANTAIMGSSMGGLISLYALCEYPLVFGLAACLSTHWTALGDHMIDYAQESLPRAGAHKLYFDYGGKGYDRQYAPWQKAMDALMVEKGYRQNQDFESWVFEDDDHNERYWSARLHLPLGFMFGKQDY